MSQAPPILNYSDEPPGTRITCERRHLSVRIYLPRERYGAMIWRQRWRIAILFAGVFLLALALTTFVRPAGPVTAGAIIAGLVVPAFMSETNDEVEIVARPELINLHVVSKYQAAETRSDNINTRIIRRENIRSIRTNWLGLSIKLHNARTIRIRAFTRAERDWAAVTIRRMLDCTNDYD